MCGVGQVLVRSPGSLGLTIRALVLSSSSFPPLPCRPTTPTLPSQKLRSFPHPNKRYSSSFVSIFTSAYKKPGSPSAECDPFFWRSDQPPLSVACALIYPTHLPMPSISAPCLPGCPYHLAHLGTYSPSRFLSPTIVSSPKTSYSFLALLTFP